MGVLGKTLDHEVGFIKFAVKIASKQDQTLHMEGKLHIILYFRVVCISIAVCLFYFVAKNSCLKLLDLVTGHLVARVNK